MRVVFFQFLARWWYSGKKTMLSRYFLSICIAFFSLRFLSFGVPSLFRYFLFKTRYCLHPTYSTVKAILEYCLCSVASSSAYYFIHFCGLFCWSLIVPGIAVVLICVAKFHIFTSFWAIDPFLCDTQ